MACKYCEYGKVEAEWPFRVSRNMAIDAGDLSLEGEIIMQTVKATCECCMGQYYRCLVCDGDEDGDS